MHFILATFFSHVFHISLTPWVANLIFGVVFGVIVAISPESINRVNIILTVAMILAWIALPGRIRDCVVLYCPGSNL